MSDSTSANNPPLDPEQPKPPPNGAGPGRVVRFVIGTIVFGVGLFVGLDYLAENWTRESTDDAFIEGHIASIASKVAGQVLATHVIENQHVKTGDLLVEIDPRDYQVRLSQKEAGLHSAHANRHAYEAGFELMRTRVKTTDSTRKQSEAEAEAAKSKFENAEAYWNRASNLWSAAGTKAISDQEYDSAKSTMESAKASWQAALQKVASDASKVTEARSQLTTAEKLYEQAGAQVDQADADVKAAELALSYTKITAPVEGQITRKMVEQGSYVQVGQSLLAIVRPKVWVIANFKETQTARIRPGQPAEIEIDGSTNRTVHGHVESLQSGAGARFSLLPPENAVGNYVKVVQRVPVKIAFDDPIEAGPGLGPGMSVVPTVQVGVRPVSRTGVTTAAVAIALIAGSLLWWLRYGRAQELS